MANIFIFHGVGGFPEENWFPWLKKKLELLGHKVFIPQFPTPEEQTIDNWLHVLKNYKKYLDNEAILVGHSLGVPFALNVIEQNPVQGAFLVAGFVGKTGLENDEEMKTFAQREFDWTQIKNNCKFFKIYHTDNDQFLNIDKAKRISKKLDTDITLIKGGGHLNTGSGYTEFDLLYKDIVKFL